MQTTYESRFKIRYSEVGVFNQIKIVNILNYFQDIAACHTAGLGISALDLYQRGFAWVVRNYRIVINQYPLWDQEIIIRSWRYPSRRLYELRVFEVLDKDHNLLIQAKTSWIMINLSNKRPARLDKHLPSPLSAFEMKIENDFELLPEMSVPQMTLPFKIRMHDLDFNRHVNNAIFVEWAVETVPQSCLQEYLPHTIEVTFLNEALYGDKIESKTQTVANSPNPIFLHTIINERDRKELTRLKTSWEKYAGAVSDESEF